MLRTLACACTLAALPALAHHGWSEYDSSKTLTLTGKILESGYEHPHGHVRIETPGKTWFVILAPPSRMENRGLPKAGISKGRTVTVVGYANRSKPEEMRAERPAQAGTQFQFEPSPPPPTRKDQTFSRAGENLVAEGYSICPRNYEALH